MTTWVLLRGWARERRHWGDFTTYLRNRLPAGDEVMAIDLPGNGELHEQPSPCSVSEMVSACRRQLQARGRAGPFAVLGLSLGAMVALQWCYEHPQEVGAAVLVNGSFGGHGAFWQRLRPPAWLPLLGLFMPGVSPLERERRVLALTSTTAASDEEIARRWAGYATERPVARISAARQLLAAARYRPPTEPPPVPLLLLASLGDRLVSPWCSRTFAQHWNLEVQLHPSAGHELALDAPTWLAAQAAAFHSSASVQGVFCQAATSSRSK